MNTVETIAEIVRLGLSMIDKYVNDPKRRLKARQEYINSLKEKMDEILKENDVEKLDKMLLDFISAIHDL